MTTITPTQNSFSSKNDINQVAESWPVMDEKAFNGPLGEIVKGIEPHSEADPVALLLNLATLYGSAVGVSPYFLVEDKKHTSNEFIAIVGNTSKGRKGTSVGYPKKIIRELDASFAENNIKSGLSSGEGLIYEVRDPQVGINNEVIDPGVKDKRRVILEEELASLFTMMKRDGNTLSPIIRDIWDGNKLSPLTKNNKISATGVHISIVGHITDHELRNSLDENSRANGFANRFMYFLVKRSKCLPEGGNLTDDDIRRLAGHLFQNFNKVHNKLERMERDDQAKNFWAEIYPELSEGKKGMFGALTARAEAHVLRLSMIYALADGSFVIRKNHLESALAIWNYAEESTRIIFNELTGDPLADKILQALNERESLSDTDIRDLVGHGILKQRRENAMQYLVRLKKAECHFKTTEGRTKTVWRPL